MGGTKPQYVIVGGFVLLMLLSLIYALIRLSGWTAETDRYFTVFRNVTGVTDGTKVYYEGYPVGRVVTVEPLTAEAASRVRELAKLPPITHFRVDLELNKGWEVSRTAEAELASPGFLSAVVVSINEKTPRGEVSAKVLPPGGFIPGTEQDSLPTVLRSLSQTAENTILERVNPAIDDVRSLTRKVAQDVPPIIEKADALVVNLNTLVEEARGYTSQGNRAQVEQLLARLNAAASDIDRLTGNANKLIDEARSVIADNRTDVKESIASFRYVMDALARDIDTINRNLEGTSRNMYEFSRQIRKNPGVLLGGTSRGDK